MLLRNKQVRKEVVRRALLGAPGCESTYIIVYSTTMCFLLSVHNRLLGDSTYEYTGDIRLVSATGLVGCALERVIWFIECVCVKGGYTVH